MDALLSPDIFISHSTKDDLEVDRIAEALRMAGLSVWVDHQNGIPIGSPSFDQMIQDNLNKCKRGLLILTGDSARSLECNGEWRHLLAHKRLYVARLKDFPQTDFPSRLAIIQYANLLRDYGQGLDALIQALQRDTTLAASHPGTALALRTSGQFPNWQLSLPLIGRDEALAKTGQLLTQARAVVLTGPGGVGKTRLAAELSSRAANPDGVIWYTLAAAATPAQAEVDLDKLTALLRGHFGLVPTDNPDTVWNTLGASQALLILDNAEDCQQPQLFVARVNQLNQRSSGLGVLITSRHVWPQLKAATPYLLPMPAAADAERMFYNMADFRLEPGLARPTAAEVATLAEAGRYHPRLLEFAATWLQAYPVRKVEQWLRTLRGEKPEEVLADVLGHTLELVAKQPHGPLALAALRRLLVCRGGFTSEAAEALLADLPEATDTLDILVAWSLLRWDGRRYDTDLLTREVEVPDSAAYPLHYDYYLTLAEQYNDQQDYASLVAEAANLEVAFEWTMLAGKVKKAYRLADTMRNMLHNRGRFTQDLAWLQRIAAALPPEAEGGLRAALLNSLGISYTVQPLGNRPANLRRAIAAYEQSLRFLIGHDAPLNYASTQNNLGVAYRDLSEISEREANLRRAVAAYEQALRFRTEQAAPLDYASTQNNLGAAYRSLSEISEREANLRRAVAAYEQALRFQTEQNAPFDYAMSQHNLGNAYSDLSEISEREANLRRAVAAYEQALRFRTEQAAPLDYAMTQTSLGITYSDLAQVSERETNLRRAIVAFEQALRFQTEQDTPLNYANTQNSLGLIYSNLSEISEHEDNLQRALTAFEQALRFRTEQAAPLDYANTQNNLGLAYFSLSETNEREANLRRAVVAFEQALRFHTEQDAPLNYAGTQNNLGLAYSGLSLVSERETNLRRAIMAFEQALRYYTEQDAPLYYASAQNNLGLTYSSLAQVSEREANLRRAIVAFEQALCHYTEQAASLNYANTQNNLGNAYKSLIYVAEPATHFNQALQAYLEAQRVAAMQKARLPYTRVTIDLGILFEIGSDLHAAIKCWQEAERHYQVMGDQAHAAQLRAWIQEAEEELRAEPPAPAA
jgi:tetratricopeptide (TPR) repeat protein